MALNTFSRNKILCFLILQVRTFRLGQGGREHKSLAEGNTARKWQRRVSNHVLGIPESLKVSPCPGRRMGALLDWSPRAVERLNWSLEGVEEGWIGCGRLGNGLTSPRPGARRHRPSLDQRPALRAHPLQRGRAWPGEARPPLRHVRRGGAPGLSSGGGVSVNPCVAGRAGAPRAGTRESGLPSHTPRGV